MTTEPNLSHIHDVDVRVSAVLGTAKIRVGSLLKMGRGGIIMFDEEMHQPIDVVVNGRLVARGELVTEDGKRGVRLTEIVKKTT